jgi:hypothetical protein
MDYGALFRDVAQHTGMYLRGESYDEVVAFLLGCDAGNDWGLLAGFREWLVVKLDGPENLAWGVLVLDQVCPGDRPLTPDENRTAIAALIGFGTEFMEARKQRDGLARIFEQHHQLLQRRARE